MPGRLARRAGSRARRTLIFLFLHRRHPARDFLCERRGGIRRRASQHQQRLEDRGKTRGAFQMIGLGDGPCQQHGCERPRRKIWRRTGELQAEPALVVVVVVGRGEVQYRMRRCGNGICRLSSICTEHGADGMAMRCDAVRCGAVRCKVEVDAAKVASTSRRQGPVGMCLRSTATRHRLDVPRGAGQLATLGEQLQPARPADWQSPTEYLRYCT